MRAQDSPAIRSTAVHQWPHGAERHVLPRQIAAAVPVGAGVAREQAMSYSLTPSRMSDCSLMSSARSFCAAQSCVSILFAG